MKKLLLLLLVCPLFTLAQTDAAKIKQREEYCILTTSPKMLSAKVNITADLGQDAKADPETEKIITKIGTFNTIVGALNYMARGGWVVVSAYTLTSDSRAGAVVSYLMKRKLD